MQPHFYSHSDTVTHSLTHARKRNGRENNDHAPQQRQPHAHHLYLSLLLSHNVWQGIEPCDPHLNTESAFPSSSSEMTLTKHCTGKNVSTDTHAHDKMMRPTCSR
ncbi:hypothetical protein BaRGS_00031845 [Batillaria attramentaria]|uniref:Uncharacterized protein n=1 Tax=Batillaria attramentaria TaxID=370345 RepID=A0ABD0JPV8_9CAEN